MTCGGAVFSTYSLTSILTPPPHPPTFIFIVNRVSEGHAFAIHDPDIFMTDIAPQFFDKQSRLRSFHRQLSIWVRWFHNFVSLGRRV